MLLFLVAELPVHITVHLLDPLPNLENRFQTYLSRGVTKRCRLSWLTNSALAYSMSPNAGGWESQPMSTAVHMKSK
jgi:hypothetical protein